jgi:mRNA degradation ribonuclease J1/J2
MRVRIHRGTKEIGGNCIELSSGGKTLVLDMGMPLTAPDPASVKLPESDGLQGDDHNFLGIVVSHPHSDHYGVLTRLIRTGEAKFRELFDWHILVFDLLAQNLTDDRRDFRLR